MHCRDCYTAAIRYILALGPPVSLESLAQDMRTAWDELTGGYPRAVFVCVAAVCGYALPDGHIMVIRDLDLATGEVMESPSPDRPTIHTALLPQQAPR